MLWPMVEATGVCCWAEFFAFSDRTEKSLAQKVLCLVWLEHPGLVQALLASVLVSPQNPSK